LSKKRASPAKKETKTQPVLDKEPLAPDATAPGYLEKARALADQMQWLEAQQWLDRALEQDPLLLEAHFLRALIYNHQGNNQQALEALRHAIYIDRHFVLGHFHSGMINWQLGRVREARRAWGVARTLLQQMQPQELLPHSDGMSAGYLLPILTEYLERVGQDGH
jgi:chemotaxis protein methyltransferase CheR